MGGLCYFNPRAPCGARPFRAICASRPFIFQSTRPVWGATLAKDSTRFAVLISIHAPRVGRDKLLLCSPIAPRIFQSTRPVWGATGSATKRFAILNYFNPRAPCGARPAKGVGTFGTSLFQSTRPVWGATVVCRSPANTPMISIHAPRVGRDLRCLPCSASQCTISIHAPRVGRDKRRQLFAGARKRISIHAPRVGRDWFKYSGLFIVHQFQSTRPVWGATGPWPSWPS